VITDLNVTDGQTYGQYTVTSSLGKNGETKYPRYYRYRRYFKLKLPVYCRFKQVNGITTAKEITEDDADHGPFRTIHHYYEECSLMLNHENEPVNN